MNQFKIRRDRSGTDGYDYGLWIRFYYGIAALVGLGSWIPCLVIYKAWKEMAGKYVIFLLLVAFTLCGCNRQKHLPESIGQPYEVVLEGDTDSIVTRMLTADVPALPQSEPMFNIIQVKKGKLGGSYLLVRNRIMVDVNPRHAGYAVKKSTDEKSAPQMILRIQARSVEELQKHLDGEKLRMLIDQSELQNLASRIHRNDTMQAKVKRLFGIGMKVPLDMNASKQGKDFLWISNNANTGMQSLLFMRVRITARSAKKNPDGLQQKVDSILRKNMLGETDSMYMVIPRLAERGLWEMKGDAMGGPYVMKKVDRKNEIIVVFGFVYAPEMKKRNLIKQLEAVLTTVR